MSGENQRNRWLRLPAWLSLRSTATAAAWSMVAVFLTVGDGVATQGAEGAERVALVIGNTEYTATRPLPNAVNDAGGVAAALGRLGFDVRTQLNADKARMDRALRDFSRQSAGASVAVVFYAGHGLEVNGENYLLPVHAELAWDTDVRYEGITLSKVMTAVEGAALRIVILDACRDNPLAQTMRRTRGVTRSVSGGSFGELDESRLGEETLVAYAAAAGMTAADGDGTNSPYTAALLEYLEQPLELSAMFRRVRARVLESTEREQRPHEYSSLLHDHYLGARPTVDGRASHAALATAPAVFVAEEYAVDPRALEGALGLGFSERRAVQLGLRTVGFDPGPVDGALGPRTRGEIRRWQAERGVATTGFLSDAEAAFLRDAGGGELEGSWRRELELWERTVKSGRPEDYEAYLAGFARGIFGDLAHARLGVLRTGEESEVLSTLLGRPPSATAADENGWTDLHYASILNLPHLIDRLVEEGAMIDARLRGDQLALSGQVGAALVSRGRNVVDWTRDGETPLHLAAWANAVDAVQRLLANGASVEAKTVHDWTPLHYAAIGGAAEAMRGLVAGGANELSRNSGGETPRDVRRRSR